MFTIKYLKFYEGCQFLKNLKVGVEYNLEHKLSPNFFRNNVCVTAIVGKNGSGKSSLIDMIFRIMNNLSYCLYRNIEKGESELIVYISGLKADLNYEVENNGEIVQGLIQVREGKIFFSYGNEKYVFDVYGEDEKSPAEHIENEDQFMPLELDGEIESFTYQKAIAKDLFYTVATNYSMQAFIAQDYDKEKPSFAYPDSIDRINRSSKTSWINHLFHKTDGYIVPIVLNPYRDNGKIDMNNEEHLTSMRLSAILLEEKPDNPFIDGYHFKDMVMTWHPRTLRDKFHSIVDDRVKMFPNQEEVDEYNSHYSAASLTGEDMGLWKYDGHEDLDKFREVAAEDNYIAHIILDELGCPVTKDMDDLQVYIRMYVVYKVLSIAENYPEYEVPGRYFGNIDYTFSGITEFEKGKDNLRKEGSLLKDLANKAKNDKSHIGIKLRQALNFIERTNNVSQDEFNDLIDYTQYAKLLGIPEKGMTIQERIDWLPPGIFHTTIYMEKEGSQKAIPLDLLSSGERQFMYLASTIAYHALNLSSVPDDGTRIKYNKLNLILDEVEICFHPEYQRLFLDRLLKMIENLGLNKNFDINIILTTHSPFLLSDIPQANVLYLQDGDIANEKDIPTNPFAANVNDILHQSFFLNNGFMGEFAQNKINDAISDLSATRNISDNRRKEIKSLIEIIGEPLLKQTLQDLYIAKFPNERDEMIRYYEEKIKELRGE